VTIAALATAWLALTAAGADAQTAVNGQIAYVASGPSTIPFGSTTQTDIWVMNADGTNPRNLTNTSDIDEFTPAWSPDGTRIAFISDAFTQTLTIMAADGSNPTPVATGATFPTWNPAGTEIAYVRGRDGLPVNIVIRTLATGVEREITGPVDFGNGVFIDVDEMEPSWSPTGDRIAFTSVRPEVMVNLLTGELEVAAQYEIVTVNIDGTGEQVVSRGDPGSDRANYLDEDRSPSWSPDGQHGALHEPVAGAVVLRAVAGMGGEPRRQRGHEPDGRRDGQRPVSVVVAGWRADPLHPRRCVWLQPLHDARADVTRHGGDRRRTLGGHVRRRGAGGGDRGGDAAHVRRQRPGRDVGPGAAARANGVRADGDPSHLVGRRGQRVQPSARHRVRHRLFRVVRHGHARAAAGRREAWLAVRRMVGRVPWRVAGLRGDDGCGEGRDGLVPAAVARDVVEVGDRGVLRHHPDRATLSAP
jgi:hypothetical protein